MDGGIGRTLPADNGTMITRAARITCAATESGTVYHAPDPTFTDRVVTSPNSSRAIVHLLVVHMTPLRERWRVLVRAEQDRRRRCQ
jgi:hypothetical protein